MGIEQPDFDPAGVTAAARAIWNAYADAPLDADLMPGEPTDYREFDDLPEQLQSRCRSYARSALFAYRGYTGRPQP